jgi:dTDP-4-dehydrorhamnose 3,5-epimerase
MGDKAMKIIETSIPSVLQISLNIDFDTRGYFVESYNFKKYSKLGILTRFVQDNHSGSKRGVLRGLHYQIQNPQGKLIYVVVGETFDVAVDIRKNSPTFGKWVGINLSHTKKEQLWIPPGFAHGFYVLSEWAEVIYKVTDFYAPKWERTLLWNDPGIGIVWPLKKGEQPLLSNKDAGGTLLSMAELPDLR